LPNPKPAILAYAAEMPASDAAQWRSVGSGRSALLVPPPPLWRLLAWPVFKLLLLLPVIGATAAAAMLSGQVLAFGLGALITTFGVIAWIGALTQLTAIARHGRKPFAIEVEYSYPATVATPTRLRISPPAWDAGRHEVAEAFSGRHVTDVRVEPLSPGVFYRAMRLYLTFADGTAISTDIPCRHDEPSQPIEQQLRHVLLSTVRRESLGVTP
jgi:hypothetical protein